MKRLRVISAILALICLTGWLALRTPYSPSQDLPEVAYSAFDFQEGSSAQGEALAGQVRAWPMVTAAAYNPASGILAVAHERKLTDDQLIADLNAAAGFRVEKKAFQIPSGPTCPVPMGVILALPSWLLGGAVGLAMFSFLLGMRSVKPAV